MNHTKPFYMELLIRSSERYHHTRPDEGHIYVPVYYMWQEDNNDQHFQFVPDQGDNCWAEVGKDTGDYVIPAEGLPSLPFKPPVFTHTYDTWHKQKRVKRKMKCVHVYHMAFLAEVPEPYYRYGDPTGASPESRIVSKKYLKSLMKLWSF
jgi:hypothetical protein